jgi:deoxyadenosine/deoxycytidine kinase
MKIVIDGNIGSGKTTQLTKLENKDFNVKREPIEDWPLELYYSDPTKWGLYFQLIVLKSHARYISGDAGIYERFPGSGTQVFWPLMEKTPAEDSVYQAMYKRHGWNPDVYIWINTSPYQCFNNMKTRDQSGDVSVSLEYLENLNKNYEKLFESMNCLKYEINGNESIDKVHEQILKIIETQYYKNGKPM